MAPCDPIRSHIKVSCSFIRPHTVHAVPFGPHIVPYDQMRSDTFPYCPIRFRMVSKESFYCPMWSLFVPYGPIHFHL